MATRLPENPTVADVIPTLKKPEEYLRRMLSNMMLCKREHGAACVRIGVTGAGVAPHYRVGPPMEGMAAPTEHLLGDEPLFCDPIDLTPWYKAYNGRGHQQIEAWGLREMGLNSWSNREMSLDDVRALLGRVRGRQRKSS